MKKGKEKQYKKNVIIDNKISIWESMTEQQLIEKIEEMKGELFYLQDAIGRAERELFYRRNPDFKRH